MNKCNVAFYIDKGEIGGNKILLEHDAGKLWLDFGLSFSKAGKYFDLLLEGRQLARTNIITLAQHKIIPPPDTIEEENNILISHPHLDHFGSVEILLEQKKDLDVNLYMPDDTRAMIDARVKIFNRQRIYKRSRLLSLNKKKQVNGFEVVPIQVDHSINGSYAYLIFSNEGSIFYTGDIRFDLISMDSIIEEITKYTEKIDILITECTGINIRTLLREGDVSEFIFKNIVERFKGLITFFTSSTYTERILSIKKAFEKTDRKIVLSPSQAYYLYSLGQEKMIENVLYRTERDSIPGWEKELQKNLKNVEWVEEKDIEKNQKKYVLLLLPHYKLEIVKIGKLNPQSVSVLSLSEPFDEESFQRMSKLEKFIKDWLFTPIFSVHANGHAPITDIGTFADKVSPEKQIVAIHSSSPETLKMLLPHRRNLLIPKYGEKVTL